jgi:hypothetical protein
MITSTIYRKISATQHVENHLAALRDYAEQQGWLVLEYLEETSVKKGDRRTVLAELFSERPHRPQGFLQIMACDVRKLFQSGIRLG